MSWRSPTYRDHHPDAPPAIQAPCCRRRDTATDMLYWVPESLRGRMPRPSEYVCDGCISRAIVLGWWTQAEYAEACGAPPERVQLLRERAA